jgi:hypothetical protein
LDRWLPVTPSDLVPDVMTLRQFTDDNALPFNFVPDTGAIFP